MSIWAATCPPLLAGMHRGRFAYAERSRPIGASVQDIWRDASVVRGIRATGMPRQNPAIAFRK